MHTNEKSVILQHSNIRNWRIVQVTRAALSSPLTLTPLYKNNERATIHKEMAMKLLTVLQEYSIWG